MKKFKATVQSKEEFNVTKEDFEKALSINENLKQDNKYYGICPYCDGPVRLIGLAHEIKVKPYGQHTENSIQNVADKKIKTIYCPFNTHKRNADPEERLINEDESTSQIKKNLIENFDVISKMINKYSDIYYSKKDKINLFKNVYKSKIWLFPEITQSNIPFIILYIIPPVEIKTKLIKKNSCLYNFLFNSKIEMIDSNVSNYVYINFNEKNRVKNIMYSFTQHRRNYNNEDECIETIHSVVSRSTRYENPENPTCICFSDEKIIINHQELFNKINYYDKKKLRDSEFLKLIKESIKKA